VYVLFGGITDHHPIPGRPATSPQPAKSGLFHALSGSWDLLASQGFPMILPVFLLVWSRRIQRYQQGEAVLRDAKVCGA
jgi:hypothetical protein